MKTLIQKELRENLKVAMAGLLLSVAVVICSQLYYVNLIEGIRTGVSAAQQYYYRLQPLTSDNFKAFSRILCIVVGLALGWFQIQSERHRDLWAFLVHRPVTRTTIFLSKASAGLLLYALVVGLPLLYFVWWVATPGHVAAPFEWGMAWPVLAEFLSGVAWYFAGMLTGIRQARWYGSRVLGLGAACLAVWDGHGIMSFWCSALFTAALALAVWGAFHNHGRFQGQPVVGKAALTLSLTPGAGGVFVAIVALGLEIFFGLYGVAIWPHYAMGRDGVVYKVIENNHTPEILSLDGQPLKDPDTGRPMELDKFNRNFGIALTIARVSRQNSFAVGPQLAWFNLASANRHTLWFNLNVSHPGRLEGYDVQTRKFIGSLGPDGFAATKDGDGSAFLPDYTWYFAAPRVEMPELFATTKKLYSVNFENRVVAPLWTVPEGDAIEFIGQNSIKTSSPVLLTRQAIILLNLAGDFGKPVWSIPVDSSNQDFATATVYGFILEDNALSYSVWMEPSLLASLGDGAKPPTQVIWLSDKGEITKKESFPSLDPISSRMGNRILNFLRPSVFQLMPQWLGHYPVPHEVDWHAVRLSFGWAIISVPVGFWLGRRYSFSVKRQLIWAVFNLFFGVPGLLAFIAVQEWPARERCPGCGQLRIVENETCEHCAAVFPAPKPTGIEIFETQPTD